METRGRAFGYSCHCYRPLWASASTVLSSLHSISACCLKTRLSASADFFRCGRDLFVTRSNVTNAFGIEWLRRHLGDGYRIHEIESRCPNPMHIDTTILPLGPGKILINPEYIDVD